MKTVFVTGMSGFVGQHLRREMAAATGWRIYEADQCDITQRSQVDAALAALASPPDAVLHLAAQSNVQASFRDPAGTFQVNLLGTLNLLQALQATAFRGRFVYVGTADAYGLVAEHELPIREDRPLHPRNPYAVSKAASEALVYQWVQTEGLNAVMLRPFNHVGPGQDDRFVVAAMAKQVARIEARVGDPVIEVGDIDVTRDFTDVRDVVRAYRMLLEKGAAGEVYNIGSGREVSVRSILEKLLSLAGVKAEIRVDSGRLRPSEQRRVRANIDRVRSDIGWAPTIDLDATLRQTLQQWKEDLSHE